MAADGSIGTLRARFATVRVRVTLVATTVVAIVLVAAAIIVVVVLREGLLRSLSGTGPQRAAEVAALGARGPLPDPLPPVTAGRVTLLQVIDANGAVIASSAQLHGAPALVDPNSRHRRIVDDLPNLGSGPWLAEPTPATIAARPVTVVVFTSLADYARGATLLGGMLLVGIPVLVALVGLVVWKVVGRSLRPVEAMRSEVAAITAHQLDRRVPVPVTQDEVGKLARTLNEMLDRLERSTEKQRLFVADASHELRTPIANIRAAVEVATAHPERADWQLVAADLLRQNQRMQRLTDDLLLLARSDVDALPLHLEPVDLSELIDEELNRSDRNGCRLTTVGPLPSVVVNGDREHLARVLSNLVENGLRYARSEVTVALTSGSTWAEITIRDDGPGVPPDDRERIFDRFVRLDPQRLRANGGAGLGLPIVRQLVDAHHGTVRVADDGPGATFRVRLPLRRVP